MQRQKGFSVIELMVTLIIISIIAGISVSVYLNMKPQLRLNGAARQVMGDLANARMKAISQNNEYKIFFVDNHQYQILDDNDNDGTIDSGEEVTTRDIQTEYYDTTFSATANPIFHPRGNAAPSTSITLTNPAGEKTITVSIAGRIKIN
ncbi:MAG: prepilin-type N-terminal cleavage/methylation domain-containing protein [Candidatus Kuenenia sp.]|nr:prepilin-type N-terminal cleavage/methylation domain-containing protein [Candidatus Kuenenia hertensis]